MDAQHVFAKNIRKYRLKRRLTQERLAEITGLDHTYISAVENSRRSISIKNIEKLSKALNISIPRLFTDR